MTHFISRIVLVLGLALSFLALPASAQQVNPTSQSVTEDALFQALGSGDSVAGRVSIPDESAGFLIKPENKLWAALQGDTLHTLSIVAVVGMIVLLALFYAIRGKIRIDGGLSGRKILRFTSIERFAHWTMASTFIVLALTGLNIIIGRDVILPLLGETAFGTISSLGKLAHNYLAWPFMISLVLVLVLWVIHNIPNATDIQWLRQGGGILKKGVHPPAKKFNAGQKLIFWAVIAGGATLGYTGVMLLFPAVAGGPADWQFYQTIHALTAAGLSAIIIAHIYIGSIGMEGAFDAMASGEVDENWAREHHSLWVDEVKNAAPKAGAQPAE